MPLLACSVAGAAISFDLASRGTALTLRLRDSFQPLICGLSPAFLAAPAQRSLQRMILLYCAAPPPWFARNAQLAHLLQHPLCIFRYIWRCFGSAAASVAETIIELPRRRGLLKILINKWVIHFIYLSKLKGMCSYLTVLSSEIDNNHQNLRYC